MKLLFVCSGNICRSPMAAEYFRHQAGQSGLCHIVVDSAGLLGIDGAPASPEAVRVMREIGVDLRGHRSTPLTATGLSTTDWTIVMTRDHLDELARRFPGGQDERHLLRAWDSRPVPDPNARDLADPIGESLEFYRKTRDSVTRCVDHLLLSLKHRS